MLLASAFVIGPLFTNLPFLTYFSSHGPYKYVIKGLTLKYVIYELPGVFRDNPYSDYVNNSLWTLYYEAMCYALVAFVGLSVSANKVFFTIFLFIYLFAELYIGGPIKNWPDINQHNELCFLREFSFPFVIGMAYYYFRDYIPCTPLLALLALLGIYACRESSAFIPIFILFGSYIIIYIGFYPSKILRNYNKLGDYSYGLYIYGWPVEQMLQAHFKVLTPYEVMAMAIPLSLLLAILSWHIIEERALKLKKLIECKTSGKHFSSRNSAGHSDRLGEAKNSGGVI